MVKNILRIVVVSLPILAWILSPSPALAQAGCVNGSAAGVDIPCYPLNPYRCSFVQAGGKNSSFCCTGADTCVAAKASVAKNPNNNVAGNKKPIFYPTGQCGEGAIDTALGCIPYTTEAFGPALLGFLAGVVGAIALIVMLFSTIQIMAAGGDAEAVKKGKELFTGAVTGLLFIIFSVTLLKIITGDILQLPGFTLVPRAYAQYQVPYQDYYAATGIKAGLTNSVGGIIGVFLPYILIIAGLVLFAMLVFGGFTMLSGAASKDGMEKGKAMVTHALIGFLIIFAAYWIAQILQVIFGISIVS